MDVRAIFEFSNMEVNVIEIYTYVRKEHQGGLSVAIWCCFDNTAGTLRVGAMRRREGGGGGLCTVAPVLYIVRCRQGDC